MIKDKEVARMEAAEICQVLKEDREKTHQEHLEKLQ